MVGLSAGGDAHHGQHGQKSRESDTPRSSARHAHVLPPSRKPRAQCITASRRCILGPGAIGEERVMTIRVGYLGVGTIGRPLAENVLKSGFELMVYDPREEAVRAMEAQGARGADSPRELGEFADVVELSV